MIRIELSDHIVDDMKCIDELKSLGLPDDLIQSLYDASQGRSAQAAMRVLRHCPFCGGAPTDPYYYDPFDGYQGDCGSYVIKCTRCHASIQRRTRLDAISAWGTIERV